MFAIIGNKIDLIGENREPVISKGKEYAKKYNVSFYVTSAKTGEGVLNAFLDIS